MAEIKKGDLVVVVGLPSCTCPYPSTEIGKIYTAEKVGFTNWTCVSCGQEHESNFVWVDKESGFEYHRLRRIPPLSELEQHKESIEA